MLVHKTSTSLINDPIQSKQLFSIFQFLHVLKILVYNPIILFGSVIRNWLIPCYYHDLNPFQYTSILEILDKDYEIVHIPNEIDIWIKGPKWRNIQVIDNCIFKLRNAGYRVKILYKTNKNNYDIRFVSCESEFGENINFMLKFYETNCFQSVDFDVNNICIKCNEENGLDTIKIISTNGIKKDLNGFGYVRNKVSFISKAIINILNKNCELICLEDHRIITRNYLLERIEKMISNGYTIENYPIIETTEEMKDACSICLEQNSGPTILKLLCNHEFHMKCLFKYWKTNQHNQDDPFESPNVRCPNCRREYALW
jgi:hypothetical protein